MKKIRKAEVWTGEQFQIKNEIFGQTVSELKANVFKWLIDNKPSSFSNVAPGYELTKRCDYIHASSERELAFLPGRFSIQKERVVVNEGWVGVDGGVKDWSKYYRFSDLEHAANHFITSKMIVRKGVDWEPIKAGEKGFPLYEIRQIRRIQGEQEVNDHLQNGWYLIELEFKGGYSDRGELGNRDATFILGYPDDDIVGDDVDPLETVERSASW